MATLIETLRAKPKRAQVAVVGKAIIRKLSLALDAEYVGVVPVTGADPWYMAMPDTVRIYGSLTGPGLILITIEKLDFDYLAETNELKWDRYASATTRARIGGEYSLNQSFPAYWSHGGYEFGAYRLKASTYPFGLVVSPRVCLETHTAPETMV